MKKLEVLIDSREVYPVKFPETFSWYQDRRASCKPEQFRVVPLTETLEVGDYCLKGFESGCVFETKRSAEELHQNLCTKDYKRFLRALTRLSKVERPIVMLDMSPSQIFRRTKWSGHPPQNWDALLRILIRLDIDLWVTGGATHDVSRRILGEMMLHTMLTHLKEKT